MPRARHNLSQQKGDEAIARPLYIIRYSAELRRYRSVQVVALLAPSLRMYPLGEYHKETALGDAARAIKNIARHWA